eukprot:7381853-Prymnesium_polylepis.2
MTIAVCRSPLGKSEWPFPRTTRSFAVTFSEESQAKHTDTRRCARPHPSTSHPSTSHPCPCPCLRPEPGRAHTEPRLRALRVRHRCAPRYVTHLVVDSAQGETRALPALSLRRWPLLVASHRCAQKLRPDSHARCAFAERAMGEAYDYEQQREELQRAGAAEAQAAAAALEHQYKEKEAAYANGPQNYWQLGCPHQLKDIVLVADIA